MKPIKVVEMEAEKNDNFELGDILKVQGVFGKNYFLVVTNEDGEYQILDLSDMTLFKEVGENPEEVIESIFSDEREDIELLTVDKIITKPK